MLKISMVIRLDLNYPNNWLVFQNIGLFSQIAFWGKKFYAIGK